MEYPTHFLELSGPRVSVGPASLPLSPLCPAFQGDQVVVPPGNLTHKHLNFLLLKAAPCVYVVGGSKKLFQQKRSTFSYSPIFKTYHGLDHKVILFIV